MLVLAHMRSSWICAVVLLAVSLAPATALNFFQPVYYRVPINFCPSVSEAPESCDPIFAASLYCQRAGFDRATFFEGPVPAKSTVAMQLMLNGQPRPLWNTTGGTMERCEATNGKTCFTFRMIICIHDKMLVGPMIDGKALDWCTTYKGQQACGWEAANAFCYRNGFWSFKGPVRSIDENGTRQDTVALDADDYQAQGQVCDNKKGECLTFGSINCEK